MTLKPGWRRAALIVFSVAALASVGVGLERAMHSPLFVVRVVEVTDQPGVAPLDAQQVERLAAVPVGRVTLFDLDLAAIERRILSNPWIREVRLQKRFPQTLAISLSYREPRAIAQSVDGKIHYLDAEGNAFAAVKLAYSADLPILEGFDLEPVSRVREALQILSGWDESSLAQLFGISSVLWDPQRGFRALISYALAPANSGLISRTWVDLGQEIDDQFAAQLERLARVLSYLSENSIATRQIWADSGRKIVVKTARGS